MVIGHVLPDKEISLLDAYEKCRSLADPKVCCDYALHMGITWWAPKVRGMNLVGNMKQLKQLSSLVSSVLLDFNLFSSRSSLASIIFRQILIPP